MRYFNPGFTCRPPLFVGWNQQDKSANIDLSGGLLTAASNAAGDGAVRSTLLRATGKYYFELNFTTITGGDTGGGLAAGDAVLTSIGSSVLKAYIQFKGGNTYKNGSLLTNNGSMAGGGILRVAYDADAKLAWLAFAGGSWNASGTANPATGVGGQSTSAFDTIGLFPAFCTGASGDTGVLNAGGTSFTYSAPSGFSAWNTS